MNNSKQFHRIFAALAFLITLITYALTLQPSVPFWDCGEFSAAAAWQQVGHPPGAPLWLIVGKLFHMLPFGDPGWRLNMVSAFSSAVSAALVYYVIVMTIERFRKATQTNSGLIISAVSGLVGTLAFTWCDTQWFNSVESEVYAAGNMLIALCVYLMMKWDQNSDKPGHERYLLAIAYVLGLAFGVHLLALLIVPAVAMVIYFKKYEFSVKSFLVLMGITAPVFYIIIYKLPLQYIPKLAASNAILGVAILGGLIALLWWSMKNQKTIVSLSVASFLMIVLGFTTYTQLLIRSNAHPPMNENEPDTFKELVSYLGREQYGNAPNWPRRYQTEQYYRRYQDTYGEWFEPTSYDDDGTPVFSQTNKGGEFNFMFKWQIGHMYWRYFSWNFIGRASDIQDAPSILSGVNAEEKKAFVDPTGYPDVFPVRFFALPLLVGLIGLYWHFRRDWKMAFVHLTLFLFLGLFPTLQQNQQQPQPRERDYFYVGSFMMFCVWIGMGAAALATKFKDEDEEKADEVAGVPTNQGFAVAMMSVCMLAAPLNMAFNGWKFHDRSKNWVPWDYSYNILQSCEKDAILFTNGDNDTFPLWYLQDVAGVRRDVRVVNLSLGQTHWYVWQLKNERPWKAEKVDISFTDEELLVDERDPRGLRPERTPPQPMSVPVPADVMKWATNGANTTEGKMDFTLTGEGEGESHYLGVQHKLVGNIIQNNHWKRPLYYSVTVGPDAWCGLDEYFRAEGMAYRIMPVKQSGSMGTEGRMNIDVMEKCFMNNLKDDESYTEPHYGFKFRNLTDKSAMFLEDHRRLMMNYRRSYSSLAQHYLSKKENAKAIATLDKLESVISPDMFDMPYYICSAIAQIYDKAGAKDKATKYAKQTISLIDELGDDWQNDYYAQTYNPIEIKAGMYNILGDEKKALDTYKSISGQYPNDPKLRSQIEAMAVENLLKKNDTAGAKAELNKVIEGYAKDTANPEMMNNLAAFKQKLEEISGAKMDTAAKK